MSVNFLLRVPVEGTELVEEVLACGSVVIGGAMVIGKAMLGDRAARELLAEKIHLVQEQNEGRFGEPVRVGDRLPQHQRLVHLVLVCCQPTCTHGNLPRYGVNSFVPWAEGLL